MKEFISTQWQRSLRTLASAKQLVETDPDSAASRAYYAAFHALTALFALHGRTFSKHTAIRTALHRELIRSQQWPAELGQAYDFLMDMRETGDYGGVIEVSKDDAKLSIEKSEAIIEEVKRT